MTSYDQAIEYLNSLINYEKIGLEKSAGRIDLVRVRRALEKAGSPQENYRIVHVAGTKGKGSVCAYASSILESSGLKTGLFTSPHLYSPLERIRVNSEDISEDGFARALERVEGISGRELTYFEALTVAALVYFAGQEAEVVVLEAGMGGRLDATNAAGSDVCCITPVSYDHTHILGNDLKEIASEKAGIIKEGVKCVVSPQKDNVLSVIKQKCLSESAEMMLAGRDIRWSISRSAETGNTFDIHTPAKDYEDCVSGLAGEFQPENCAVAVGVCEALLGESAEPEAFRRGISRAFLPGRLEIIARRPLIVLDGAQNAESAVRLKYSVERIFNYDRLILLAGLASDKDIKGFFSVLAPLADEIILTRASNPRAADPDMLRGHARGRRAEVTRCVKEAMGVAFSRARDRDMILVAGSFCLAGEVREMLAND